MQNPSVSGLFQAIAARYDRMNRLISLGQDLRWRRQAAAYLRALQPKRLLDLAAGTGDFALAASQTLPSLAEVYLVDITPAMLAYAPAKKPNRPSLTWHIVEADAHQLPFAERFFDAITVGFGVRNFSDRLRALQEMHRVLRQGGKAVILETGVPRNPLWRALFQVYFRFWVPLLGALIAGHKAAYTYLPESTERFPHREGFLYLCQKAGFARSSFHEFMGGVAILYILEKDD